MRRLVLHIGLEKTGSTSFQAFCADHRDALAEHGVLYPANGACFKAINHAPWVASYFTPAEAKALLIAGRRAGRDEAIGALNAEIEAADAPTTLVSAEHFSSRFDPRRIAALAADLAGFDVAIAVVVRHPLARARSAYATTIASGRAIGLDGFVDELCDPANPYLRCRATLEPWAAVFGGRRMIVVAYREGEDIVAALAAKLLPGVLPAPYRRNVSPADAEIERRRRRNAGGTKVFAFARWLARDRPGGAPTALSPDQSRRIRAATEADLAWLRETHGVDFGDDPVPVG